MGLTSIGIAVTPKTLSFMMPAGNRNAHVVKAGTCMGENYLGLEEGFIATWAEGGAGGIVYFPVSGRESRDHGRVFQS